MWSTIFAVLASLFGAWAIFKYLLLTEIRIDTNTFKIIYDLCKEEKKIVLYEELVTDSRHPVVFTAFCFFNGAPWIFINRGERLMQAGWHGKDDITMISCFRWNHKKLKNYLKCEIKERQFNVLGVPVELMLPSGADKIGSLKELFPEPVVDEKLWKDFDQEVEEVAQGKRTKTSGLFYGAPGNGKSSFIKYLASKHRLPIMIFTLDPEWNNHDLLLLFAQIPKKCIVLFEDFDNYFHGRKCVIGGENKFVRFTFDIILNGLDGVYTTHESVVFIMTVNDISKVDVALRNRPSRFKYTRCFDNPNLEVRKKVLPTDWAEKSDGLNLDQIFRLKEYQQKGISFENSMSMLEKDLEDFEIQKVAHEIFLERVSSSIDGTQEGDWNNAVRELRLR